jgi:hypothetical protein
MCMRGLALLGLLLPGCIIIADDAPNPEEGEPAIFGAGLSYGECLGYCTHRLSLDDRDLELVHTSNGDAPDLISEGRLTDEGAAAIAALRDALAGEVLQETYGCPDCNDGGDAYLDYLPGGDIVYRVHWAADDPAPEVTAAHDLLIDDLLRGLSTCDATPNLIIGDCEPVD